MKPSLYYHDVTRYPPRPRRVLYTTIKLLYVSLFPILPSYTRVYPFWSILFSSQFILSNVRFTFQVIIACLIIIDKLTKIEHSLPKNDGHDRCHQQKYHRAGDDEGGALKRWIRVVRSIDHLENKEDPSLDDSLFQSLPNI